MEELPQPNGLVKSMRQLIQSEANNNPPATLCTIKKVYDDNKHIDAQLNGGDVLEYLKTIGNPVKDNEGVVIFLDGDTSTPIVIVWKKVKKEKWCIMDVHTGIPAPKMKVNVVIL